MEMKERRRDGNLYVAERNCNSRLIAWEERSDFFFFSPLLRSSFQLDEVREEGAGLDSCATDSVYTEI